MPVTALCFSLCNNTWIVQAGARAAVQQAAKRGAGGRDGICRCNAALAVQPGLGTGRQLRQLVVGHQCHHKRRRVVQQPRRQALPGGQQAEPAREAGHRAGQPHEQAGGVQVELQLQRCRGRAGQEEVFVRTSGAVVATGMSWHTDAAAGRQQAGQPGCPMLPATLLDLPRQPHSPCCAPGWGQRPAPPPQRR